LRLFIIFEQTKSDRIDETVEVGKYYRINSIPFVVFESRGDNELLIDERITLIEVRF
jgi:hypothetical protein